MVDDDPLQLDYPPWLDKYSSSLLNKLWLPTDPKIKFDLPYEFDTCAKYIKFSCLSDEDIKITSFDYESNDINSEISQELEKIKLEEQLNKKLEKYKNMEITDIKKLTQLYTIYNKHKKAIGNVNNYIRSYKQSLILSNEQEIIIQKWMKIATIVYNKSVDYYNISKGKIPLDYKKLKLIIFKMIPSEKLSECPYNILSYEVKEFCSNVKSNLTKIRNGSGRYFTMTHKNIKIKQTLTIEHQNIQEDGFYKSFLGKIKVNDKNFSFGNIVCDMKLMFDKQNEKYYLYAPQYIEGKTINNRHKICAIDPGEKIFGTIYGLDHVSKIGEDIRKPILEYETQIRKIQRLLSKTTNKRQKERYKLAIRRKYKKIKGIVTELRNKMAIHLCKNYERILIPEFATQQMVCNKNKVNRKIKREIKKEKTKLAESVKTKEELHTKLKIYKKHIRLNSRVKFVLNMLSHYKFRQHLISKGAEYGCLVKVVTEEYTSQCCGKCGRLGKKYNKDRVKCCEECGTKIDRDYNGSRNILIKEIRETLVETSRVKPA